MIDLGGYAVLIGAGFFILLVILIIWGASFFGNPPPKPKPWSLFENGDPNKPLPSSPAKNTLEAINK